jgi:hypothetical protein
VVDAGQSDYSKTAAGIAEQDSHESGSAAEQHCSAELLDQALLHWRVAYADAGLGSAAPALNWQAIPVDSVLHHLHSAHSVHRMRARGKQDSSTWIAHETADRVVEMIVHKVGEVAASMDMGVVVPVVVGVHKAELG